MAVRRTIRGAERTPLEGRREVLICGASFAGLAAACRLAGSGADVLVLDRYEIGDRQTSACAIPTAWLEKLELMEAERQRFDSMLIHTPHGTRRLPVPWSFSTFDYRQACDLLWRRCDADFEFAKVDCRAPNSDGGETISVATDRGTISAPLVVDALGWRRVLATADRYQPPEAPLSRGLEVHPGGRSDELEIWIDRDYVPAGYGWSFPADREVRIGVGSFDPGYHVREPTERLAADLQRESVGYQGNWIPHRLRPATEGGVFFAGDSAGHCLPLTAEGIRTALYFGLECGDRLRAVIEGRETRSTALERYARFSDRHAWKFRLLLRAQRALPRIPPRILIATIGAASWAPFSKWAFNHYMNIAPPGSASPLPAGTAVRL